MSETKRNRRVTHWLDAEVGDLVIIDHLIDRHGKFYRMGERAMCDMPTATFELATDVPGVWYRRVE